MKRRLSAVAAGLGAALLPLVARAQEHGGGVDFEAASRAADPSDGFGAIMIVTIAATVGLFLLSTIGYLYRRERGLEWRFQQPDAPHADHH